MNGKRVTVHFNLQAAAKGEPVWSVTYQGKVTHHECFFLYNVTPRYWKGRDGRDGRKATGQYLSTHGGKRTVHAWMCGVAVDGVPGQLPMAEITYNPKRRAVFHDRDGNEFHASEFMLFDTDGKAYAIGWRC